MISTREDWSKRLSPNTVDLITLNLILMPKIINTPGALFPDENSKNIEAIKNIDLIFPYFNRDGNAFTIPGCIEKFCHDNKKPAVEIIKMNATATIMWETLHQEGFLKTDDFGRGVRLTDPKGLKAFDLGGRSAYKNMIKEGEQRATEEKELSFKKLKIDVANATRVFKTYWWTFAFAVIGLAISLYLLIIKIIESYD